MNPNSVENEETNLSMKNVNPNSVENKSNLSTKTVKDHPRPLSCVSSGLLFRKNAKRREPEILLGTDADGRFFLLTEQRDSNADHHERVCHAVKVWIGLEIHPSDLTESWSQLQGVCQKQDSATLLSADNASAKLLPGYWNGSGSHFHR